MVEPLKQVVKGSINFMYGENSVEREESTFYVLYVL